jgi:signal transduction histidine kinase
MERKAQAEKLCAGLVPSAVLDSNAEATIRMFATDPKWEVRKVVAEALSHLPEPIFRELRPQLSSDSNAFVNAAARRSSQRRVPSASLAAPTPGKIQQAIDGIAAKHGNDAAEDAIRLAHLVTERHLRSAVHDIKNILVAISLDPDAFTSIPAAQKRKLLRCKQGAEYLRHLLDMMTQYTADPKLELQSESIAEIVEEARASAVGQIERGGRPVAGVECVFSIPDGLTVRVSRFHILMVFTNLIKNGIESHAISPTEMKRGCVQISAQLIGNELVISVIDQGRGIAPGDLAQLREFIPGGSSKPKIGINAGTGYGLPICRRYVEFHRGSFAIDSTDGVGTVVTFRLPHMTEAEK